MLDSQSKPFLVLVTFLIALPVSAQEFRGYKLVPKTIYEKKPVKVTKWVDEVVNEKKTVTTYRAIWETETRERKTTEYKPIEKTSQREERTIVRKPVTETRYRKKEIRETTYEPVTEMREETYTVRKPVVETNFREEQVTVRKPVTQQLIEVQRTTTFKPVLKKETNYVPGATVIAEPQAVPDPNQRPRMQWLTAGYYTDPATGLSVYRRRGLHWVQPSMVVPAATVPSLVPTETEEWSFEPEVTETRKPVDITHYVEATETRKVPVEVRRYVDQVETRKVPVTVQVPRTTVTVEEIPYTETTYQDEVIVKQVPYTETTYQKVETIEPYEVEVSKWVPVTKEVDVPRTVRKKIEYEEIRDVPRTVMFKVPVDECGLEIGPAVPAYPVTQAVDPALESKFSAAYGAANQPSASSSVPETITSRRVEPEQENAAQSVLETESDPQNENYQGELKLVEPKQLDETSGRKSIDVPDTRSEIASENLQPIPGASARNTNSTNPPEGMNPLDADQETPTVIPATPVEVQPVPMPEDEPSRTGNENAAEPSKPADSETAE